MANEHFDMVEWMREQVRESGLTQRQIHHITGMTEKHISQMMNHETGSVEAWQRILNALPHINRYKLPDAAVHVLRLCDYWDLMSKGESPTTRTIRMVIKKGYRDGA